MIIRNELIRYCTISLLISFFLVEMVHANHKEIFAYYDKQIKEHNSQKHYEKLLNKLIKVDLRSYDPVKQAVVISQPARKQRNRLIKLLLKKISNLDQFLEKITSQQILLTNNGNRLFAIQNYEDLILLALKNGAKFENTNIKRFYIPPSLQAIKIMLYNNYCPNRLLHLLLDYHIGRNAPNQKELVLLALKHGADPNLIISSCYYPIKIFHGNTHIPPNILQILFSNQYKKIDPKLLLLQMEALGQDYFRVNQLNYLLDNPSKAIEMKFKNLRTIKFAKSAGAKIPRIVHHVWLTNTQQQKDISPEDLANLLHTQKLFSQKNNSWQHIVWTNDRQAMKKSTKILKAHGIQLRGINELKHEYSTLYGILIQSIDKGQWGPAGDITRTCVMHKYGGIYADLDYIFAKDMEEEIHQYDFLIHDFSSIFIDGFLFIAKPHHPILTAHLKLLTRNFISPPSYISMVKPGTTTYVSYVSGAAFSISYCQAANQNNNIDVAYPYGSDYEHLYNTCVPEYLGVKGKESFDEIVAIIRKYVPNSDNFLNFLQKEINMYNYFDQHRLSREGWWKSLGYHEGKKGWINTLQKIEN